MRIPITLIAALVFPVCSSASLISTVPDTAITTTFDGGATCSPSGAETVTDAGFSMSSDGDACFGYSGQYNFDGNGLWTGMPMIADASGFTTITIALGGYYSAAGGFMDFSLDDSNFGENLPEGNDPVMTALDVNMNVIDSFDVFDFIAGEYSDENQGRFLGISSASNNISYFQISGDGIALDNISLVSPEPGTLVLFGLALLATGLLGRRKSL